MMYFDFHLGGGHIQCKDGECGKLAGLVIEPETRQVTDLIVKEGHLLTQAHVLPLTLVQSALEDNVNLSISSHEIDQYPEYRVTTIEEPVTELEHSSMRVATPYGLYGPSEPTVPMVKRKIREGIVLGQEVIEPGMPVNNAEGKIGKVIRVLINREQGEMVYLAVQRGMFFSERLVIPNSMVEDVHESGIQITGTDKALEHLAHYESTVETDFLTR
jgi:uncharacterized protein YrrD